MREREREREREGGEGEREYIYRSIIFLHLSVCLSVCLFVGPSVCQSVFDKAVTN